MTEQGLCEILAERLCDCFRRPSTQGYWLMGHEQRWSSENSIGLLWTAVVAAIRAQPQEDENVRRRARLMSGDELLSERGFRAILKLLEQDPRLQVRPEDFDSDPRQLNLAGGWIDLKTGERHPRAPTPMFTKAAPCFDLDWLDTLPFRSMLAQRVSGDASAIVGFIRAGLSQERDSRRVLYVDSRLAPDLSPLYPVLEALLGEYICRLSWKVWSHWPDSLDIPLCMRLSGVRILFLDPAPNGRFQAELLDRIVRAEWEERIGLDGSTFRVRVPSHFILGGQVSFLAPWQQELLSLLQTVSGPRGER